MIALALTGVARREALRRLAVLVAQSTGSDEVTADNLSRAVMAVIDGGIPAAIEAANATGANPASIAGAIAIVATYLPLDIGIDIRRIADQAPQIFIDTLNRTASDRVPRAFRQGLESGLDPNAASLQAVVGLVVDYLNTLRAVSGITGARPLSILSLISLSMLAIEAARRIIVPLVAGVPA